MSKLHLVFGGRVADPRTLDFADLNAIGVGVHNPHQWNVDFNVEQTAELARLTDPNGLLNPGKLNPDYSGARKGAIIS